MSEIVPAPITRVTSGIVGFDQISHGGLVKGRMTLIAGTSGSGKTLFCIQSLHRRIREHGSRVVFVTFEERPRDLMRNVIALGWDLSEFVAEDKLRFLDASVDYSVIGESGHYDLSGLIAQVRYTCEQINADMVVLDSMAALFERFDNAAGLRYEIGRLVHELGNLEVTSLMTAERLEEYGRLTRHGIEDFLSDCVVVLRHALEKERVRRTVEVYKLRGGSHDGGEVPFVIGDRGIEVLPLTALTMADESSSERISMGNAVLDQMTGGGIFDSSIVLVSGPTGAGKTLMASTFAEDGCEAGERVLFLGYEESRQQLARNAGSWGLDFRRWEQAGLLKIECRYPETFGWEKHLLNIQLQVERFAPKRLVLDSISGLERVTEERHFREFIIALTSYLKSKGICTVITSTTPRLSGGDSITDAHISTITDAILLLRYVEVEASLRRGVVVIKMRGSQHDKHVREFTVGSNGLTVGAPFARIPNILAGIPSPETSGRSAE